LLEHPEVCKLIEEKIRSVLLPPEENDENLNNTKVKNEPKKSEQKDLL